MKQLIVTADDFGLTFGVVSGIVEGHRRGIVTSTSAMVQAPAWSTAVEAANENPRLAVGLHLVLTAGRPVGDGAGLAAIINEDGRFRRLDEDRHAEAAPSGVAREAEAQLRRMRDEMGRSASHIDSHHHAHGVPQVLEGLVDVAREEGVPIRACSAEVMEACDEGGVRLTGSFIDRFYDDPGSGRGVSVESLCGIIDELSGSGPWELMCHPAHPDPLLRKISSYHESRTAELRTLIDPIVRDRLVTRGVELTTPGEII